MRREKLIYTVRQGVKINLELHLYSETPHSIQLITRDLDIENYNNQDENIGNGIYLSNDESSFYINPCFEPLKIIFHEGERKEYELKKIETDELWNRYVTFYDFDGNQIVDIDRHSFFDRSKYMSMMMSSKSEERHKVADFHSFAQILHLNKTINPDILSVKMRCILDTWIYKYLMTDNYYVLFNIDISPNGTVEYSTGTRGSSYEELIENIRDIAELKLKHGYKW